MRKIVLILFCLFNILSIVTDGELNIGEQTVLAQRMYSEPIDGGSLWEVDVTGDASTGRDDGFKDPGDNFGDGDDLFAGGENNGNSDSGSEDNSGSDLDPMPDDPGPGNSSSNKPSTPYCKEIRKEDIERGLKKPSDKIMQNGSTCSAAVIQKLLAETDPQLYRQIVMSLYRTGEYKPLGLKLSDCYQSLKPSEVEQLKDPVDLIMQCAIINKMNDHMHYDSTLDNGNNIIGNLAGFQWPGDVEEFILETLSYNTVDNDDINQGLIRYLDYSDFFVIALVNYSSDRNNYDFEGNKFHYAQITRATDDYIYYWSWGGTNMASMKSWTGIHYVILVKK